MSSEKRLRNDTARLLLFNEWFLSILLSYLQMRDIVTIDSTICNKSDRAKWLECIANDIGSVTSKIQPYVTNDSSINWCFQKKLKFRKLEFEFDMKSFSITASGASLLALCCVKLIEFLVHWNLKGSNACLSKIILIELGQQCSKLQKLMLNSSAVSDKELTPLLLRNHELKDMNILHCKHVTDSSLMVLAANCNRLRMLRFIDIDNFTDDGVLDLVSNNHDLEEITFDNSKFITDKCLLAIAENCHNLKRVDIRITKRITDNGLIALACGNHGLEDITICECPLLTDASWIAIADNCHDLRTVRIWYRDPSDDNRDMDDDISFGPDFEIVFNNVVFENTITDKGLIAIAQSCHKLKSIEIHHANLITDIGIVTLVKNNVNLEEVCVRSCSLLTEVSLLAIVDNCQILKSLIFARSVNLSKSCIEYVHAKCAGSVNLYVH